MTIADWLIIAATLSGPVLAVQAQKWIERATENRKRRITIFEVLMANRATRLSDEYVRALNMIDLVFLPRGLTAEADRRVINAWRSLLGELNDLPHDQTNQAALEAWGTRCLNRHIALLMAMSASLGFGFSEEELRRGVYYPKAHVDREVALLAIMQGMQQLLVGTRALNMKVTEFPTSPEAVQLQTQLTEKMARAYTEDGELKVKITSTPEEQK
jgi:hypothetical protein